MALRGQAALPQGIAGVPQTCMRHNTPCRSRPAREGGLLTARMLIMPARCAGKPRSTRNRVSTNAAIVSRHVFDQLLDAHVRAAALRYSKTPAATRCSRSSHWVKGGTTATTTSVVHHQDLPTVQWLVASMQGFDHLLLGGRQVGRPPDKEQGGLLEQPLGARPSTRCSAQQCAVPVPRPATGRAPCSTTIRFLAVWRRFESRLSASTAISSSTRRRPRR